MGEKEPCEKLLALPDPRHMHRRGIVGLKVLNTRGLGFLVLDRSCATHVSGIAAFCWRSMHSSAEGTSEQGLKVVLTASMCSYPTSSAAWTEAEHVEGLFEKP